MALYDRVPLAICLAPKTLMISHVTISLHISLRGLGQRGCSKGTVILLRVSPLRSKISCPDSTMRSGLSVRSKVLVLMLDSESAKVRMSNGDDFCLENRRIDGESIW